MHKSKLGGFIIDCDTDDLEAATRFWSHALGMPVHELKGSENASYRGSPMCSTDSTSKCSRWTTQAGFISTSRPTISTPKCLDSRRSAREKFGKCTTGG